MQKNNLFHLTKDTIDKIRYIRLNKKASYSEKGLEKTTYCKGSGNGGRAVQFYAFGFYDSLICIKPEKITSASYKEHFLISYPYEKKAYTSKVEQWFGIFPLSEEKRCSSGAVLDGKEDPFFCESTLQAELPFIGVILVSLGNISKCKQPRNFDLLLSEYTEKAMAVFEEIGQEEKELRYVAELYYSLNCSDLCVVIRTDALPLVHRVNSGLKRKAADSDCAINTTVIFGVQDATDGDRLHALAQKNKDVTFVVRSDEKYDDRSKGVNGIGRYVTKLGYEEYVADLPQLFIHKLGKENNLNIDIGEFAKSIRHEREWFTENFEEAVQGNGDSVLQEAICFWIKEVHDQIVGIGNLAEKIFTCSKELYGYVDIFEGELCLIKDLIYSYSDLWYQNASDSGFIFFAQIKIALSGIQSMLEEIRDDDEDMSVISGERLFEVMHSIACDLNGYNKQFQFLNQDSVNFPSYEIQSKVNAEKYMAAYCSFLHGFFSLCYQEKTEESSVVQSFPLALVDLSERKIIANIFFSSIYMRKTKKENEKVRGLFAVHFPNSEYFSNLWKSIPLLMHEVSHTQNYGGTADRNGAVVYNIDICFAEMLADKLLKCVNDGFVVHDTAFFLKKVLKEKIYNAIVSTRKEFFDDAEFASLDMDELLEKCADFYDSLFDRYENKKSITYNQIKTLKVNMEKDIEVIMQAVGFGDICYAFNESSRCPSAIGYFINELYLEFHPDFYEKYKGKYDPYFQENLQKEIAGEAEDTVEKEILLCTLYRFKMFIKKSEKGEVEEPDHDALVIAFTMVLTIGMRAIFENYRNKYNKKLSDVIYYKALIPNPYIGNLPGFMDQLVNTYDQCKAELEREREAAVHDLALMEAMLYEYYELFVSIENVYSFLESGQYPVPETAVHYADKFIEKIHDECIEYIHGVERSNDFKFAFAGCNRKQLVKLGFFEKDTTILKKVFRQVYAENSSTLVEDMIEDRAELFSEVYADCGMCCAMGFEPFGYCMFALSIHDIVNDLNAVNAHANFLTDRICSVLRMYLPDSDGDRWVDIFKEFLGKLCDTKMVASMCEMISANTEDYKEDKEDKNSEDSKKVENEKVKEIRSRLEEYKSVEFEDSFEEFKQKLGTEYTSLLTEWKDNVIGELIDIVTDEYHKESNDAIKRDKLLVAKNYLLRVYKVLQLFFEEDALSLILTDNFNGFFQGVREHIEKGGGIKAVKKDACVKEISSFYNMDCPKGETSKFEWYYKTYCGGFLTQCNFIFDNYCKYRNAYDSLRQKIRINNGEKVSHGISDWFEVIDSYYYDGGEASGRKSD